MRVRGGIVGAMALVLLVSAICAAGETGYRFAKSWGKPGTGPSEFHEPIGIAVSGKEVFVSDAGNNRIQVFDLEGNMLRAFGRAGNGPGELARPMHMDVHDGKLYVAEYGNDRIQIFSLAGEPLTTVGTSGHGPGQFDSPGGVAVDRQGRLYVADFFNHRIQFLEADGRFIRQYGETGKKGRWGGRFNYPTDVALLPDGSLSVADAYNNRIQLFAPDSSLVRRWGGLFGFGIAGKFNGWFRVATSIAVGPTGNIFVTDFYNNRVQKFSPQGKFLTSVGTQEIGLGQLHYPTDVALDAEGNLYVVDFGNSRIVKFTVLHFRVVTIFLPDLPGSLRSPSFHFL